MMDYNRAAVIAKMRELDSARQATRDTDPDVADARRALERAQGTLDQETHGRANMVQDYRWVHWTQAQRASVSEQWSERVIAARQGVKDAEEALRKAENDHARKQYLAQLEAKKKEQKAAHDAEQARYAAEQEAAAKENFKAAYLAGGGTDAEFAAAWPSMWRKELEARAIANKDTAREKLLASGRYDF